MGFTHYVNNKIVYDIINEKKVTDIAHEFASVVGRKLESRILSEVQIIMY